MAHGWQRVRAFEGSGRCTAWLHGGRSPNIQSAGTSSSLHRLRSSKTDSTCDSPFSCQRRTQTSFDAERRRACDGAVLPWSRGSGSGKRQDGASSSRALLLACVDGRAQHGLRLRFPVRSRGFTSEIGPRRLHRNVCALQRSVCALQCQASPRPHLRRSTSGRVPAGTGTGTCTARTGRSRGEVPLPALAL